MEHATGRPWSRTVLKTTHERKSVLIVVPNTGTLRTEVADYLLYLANDQRYALTFTNPIGQPMDENLNQSAKAMMQGTWDFMLRMDSDQCPVRGANVLDLVELDLPVVGCPTPAYRYRGPDQLPYFWNVLDHVKDKDYKVHAETTGLQRVDVVGGCEMIRRDVFEVLGDAPFRCMYDDDGYIYATEGLAFCSRVRDAGLAIYAHYDYPNHHWKTIDLLQAVQCHTNHEATQAKLAEEVLCESH